MLRACRSVLRPGGRIAYYNIFVPPGLPEHLRRRAHRAGPSAVGSRGIPQTELLARAGFESITETDVTEEFLATARAWNGGRQRRESQLRAEFGDAWFEERQADSRAMLSSIEQGLLRRSLFLASRPRS